MYLAPHQPDLPPATPTVIPAFVRTNSLLRVELAATGGRTGPARVHEAGALRLRFPRVGGACEGIILNTSGGIAGGDRQSIEIAAGGDSTAAITTQSAEKVYRSDGDMAHIVASIDVRFAREFFLARRRRRFCSTRRGSRGVST